MITLTLTDNEAKKLRKYLGQTCTDPALARIYEKLDASLKRPAVERKWKFNHEPPQFRWKEEE